MKPMKFNNLALSLALLAGLARAEAPTGNAPYGEVAREIRRLETAQAKGQVDALRMEYQELVRAKPADVLARVYMAWVYMPSDETWNQLKGLTGIYPEHPWLAYGMARVYTAWKMKDQARDGYLKALKAQPTFTLALVGLGDLARQKEDWAEAEKQYRAALAQAPEATALGGLGLTLLAQGKAEEARDALKKSIAAWPEQPVLLQSLLKLCQDAKDPATADIAGKLAELQPKNRDAWRVLADLRFDAGDKKAAAAVYEKVFRLGTPEPELVKRVAAIDRELGDAEGEERMVESLQALEPQVADHPMRLAALLLARKDTAGAEGRYLEAVARDPKVAEAHVALAKMKMEQKSLHEAAEHYRAAAKLEGPFAEEARAAGAKLEKDFDLPKKSFTGGPDAIYVKVSITLGKLFEKRVLLKPGLNGTLQVRVHITAEGVVEGVDIVQDTVGDPVMTAHAYLALKDATFPAKKRDPLFEFEVGKKRGK